MKEFFGRVLAAMLGTGVAIAAIAGFCLLLLMIVGASSGGPPSIDDGSWLVLDMRGGIPEYAPPAGPLGILSGESETLQRLLDNLEKAAADERIEGVVLKLATDHGFGAAKSQEFRAAVKGVQDAGKQVIAYAESLDRPTVYLAANADKIVVPPTAYINFIGFGLETTHVKGMLEKLGIEPNVHKIKDYKAAAELVTRKDMSDGAIENREWMLEDFWKQFVETLEADRGLDEAKILALMEHALFEAEEAKEGGLVDEIKYWDELAAELAGGDADEWETVASAGYGKVTFDSLDLGGDKKIAVVHAQGMIGGRESTINPLLGAMMGYETVIADLERARKDEDVVAIVLRIDSGGGDAYGSDMMGHEVERIAAEKPIIASMVDVAASGGYHMAYRATKIVASPGSVAGSIGSISAKFNMSGLHDKLGITHDHLEKGPMARIYSSNRNFTDAERARFEENHWAGFNAWLRDVAEHRGMTFEQAEALAHGRVFTGVQAKENGLIDELGGLAEAIAIAKELAGVDASEGVDVMHLPVAKSPIEALLSQDDPAAAAINHALYRFIHEDLAETKTLLTERELAWSEVPALR